MSTTIAAISTPQGQGGMGTVRISGDDARAVADRVFKSVSGRTVADAKGYSAMFGTVYSEGEPLDEAVALIFAAPRSYTGEDVVELSVHGGTAIMRYLLRAVLDAGALPAGAGEFTKRAFQNGKLDLAEAESVMTLISAQGRQDLRLSLAAKQGRVSREIGEIREKLLEVDASMAVFADYPDEDLPELDETVIREKLYAVKKALNELLIGYDKGKILREGILTAIIGTPNVGKSTLMNMLSGGARSIVTPIAGTTRDVIEETVRVGELTLRISDTAGIHTAADEVEKIGIDRACECAESADLLLAVFDVGRPLSEDDRRVLSLCRGRSAIAVLNKSDLPARIELSEIDLPTVTISAEKGLGEAELAAEIAKTVGTDMLGADRAVLQSERQRSCAFRAYTSVCEAVASMEQGYTLDAVGICADEALGALLELTGERVTEAVADEVFSRFCVGK